MTVRSENGDPPRRTIRTTKALTDAGLLAGAAPETIDEVTARFAMSITPTMVEQMGAMPDDPIARQFVPSAEELHISADELADPIGDDAHSPVPGIVHRYRDRVLLKALQVCPVYCRFCFRRESVGQGQGLLQEHELTAALSYVADHPEIWEVILSGGDPLLLSPARLRRIVAALDRIPHIGVIRVHTRVPIVAPDRLTTALVDALRADTPVWMVLHCNHSQELGARSRAALSDLTAAGIPLLSQTVLLKGVNDTAAALTTLFRDLVALKVKPYYLHQGDLAPGTGHMRTTIAAGQELMRQLRGPVSGLCQPTYVLDIPGGYGKVPIGASYLDEDVDGYLVRDPDGAVHRYAPHTVNDRANSLRRDTVAPESRL
ncbi:lysine-2,3-aminomutase-like protein [Nocardia barduliensis]|uniref:lysine-2,3-aminomutase-like protein n=1 Tax=Nocardia barduliensis TaxID=2736643 RepID=UPI00157190F9|nr:lysine-2,3-aminomutase-like protein [Nocardia barduliensis]